MKDVERMEKKTTTFEQVCGAAVLCSAVSRPIHGNDAWKDKHKSQAIYTNNTTPHHEHLYNFHHFDNNDDVAVDFPFVCWEWFRICWVCVHARNVTLRRVRQPEQMTRKHTKLWAIRLTAQWETVILSPWRIPFYNKMFLKILYFLLIQTVFFLSISFFFFFIRLFIQFREISLKRCES